MDQIVKHIKDLAPGEQIQWGLVRVIHTIDGYVEQYHGPKLVDRTLFNSHPDVTRDYTGCFGGEGKIRKA